MTIPEGKTLRIGAGTTVTWSQSKVLIVEGRLEVVGDSTNPATLLGTDGNTSDEVIVVKDTAEIVMNDCVISGFSGIYYPLFYYQGQTLGDIYENGGITPSFEMTSCLVKDNQKRLIAGNYASMTVDNSSFLRNAIADSTANTVLDCTCLHTFTVKNSSFQAGGGISAGYGGIIEYNTFTGNPIGFRHTLVHILSQQTSYSNLKPPLPVKDIAVRNNYFTNNTGGDYVLRIDMGSHGNVGTGGIAEVTNNTFFGNVLQNGGTVISVGQYYEQVTISGNLIEANTAGVIMNNDIGNNLCGILSEDISGHRLQVTNNRLSGNSFTRSVFYVRSSSPSVSIAYNIITSNVVPIDTDSSPWSLRSILGLESGFCDSWTKASDVDRLPDLQNNDIYGNTADYLLYLDYTTSQVLVGDTYDVSGNWWGTTDISLIETQAYDYTDDYKLPKTNFAPMLDRPAK